MARKPVIDMSAWPSLSLEGNLIAPAMVATIDRRESAEQKEADYRIRKGLTLREEISTAFRVGQSHFDAFAKNEHPSAEATRRFIRAFLQETFGFDDLAAADGALSFIAGERVPIVVVPPSDEKLDRRSPTLSVDRSRSPAFALQDYLNEHEETLWGLVTNGTLIRLVRDNASLTRPAYIEADLAQIFTNEDAASFAVLWLLIHRSRFGVIGAPVTDCALERWRDAGSREGEVARDRLAVQVQIALKVLGSGFLEANPDLAAKLKSGEVNLTDWFNELLRLVYRLIFLMVAEDRNLLHPEKAAAPARKLYAEGYSLGALRAQCYRAASWDKHHDRYEGIKIVFHALAHGQDALALPALGGLFSEDKLPHLETARLRNRAFMEALYRLSWLTDKTGMVPVNWRAMETEELGSVYESLLELQPQLGDDGKSFGFATEAAEQKGNQRKTTGSYYTPDSLVQALLDTALDPVLDRTEAEADDPAKALLKLSIIDPACGSGHFLLAAARRIATRVARIRADGTPALSDFRHALRDVARSCLHGVDRNPMAVELTKVALWIETVDPGLPLGFFDAQIRCGDALLGVFDIKVLEDGIPDAAYKPLTGDDKDTVKYYARANKDAKGGQGRLDFTGGRSRLPAIRPIATEYTGFRALSEDTLEDIITKDRRFRTIREGEAFHKAEMACDLYIAAFLLPKIGGAPTSRGTRLVPTTSDVWQALDDGQVWGPIIGQATIARRARAFHWSLEFPDLMQHGGFDVVLGNPPWERIKLQEQEFFAARSPEIAGASNKAARERLIKALENAAKGSPERALFDTFIAAKREAEATSEFVRLVRDEGGRFTLTGRGDVNTYALFAELFANLSRDHAGMIVPTGIATDATTAPFFAAMVEQKRLAKLVDFENRDAIFAAVHRSFKFCILTLGRYEPKAHFAFFLTDPAQIAEPERNFTLTPDAIARLNPNTLTASVFRSRADASLTAKIYEIAPVLIDERPGVVVNPWKLDFHSRIWHMSEDAQWFRTSEQLAANGLVRAGDKWGQPAPSLARDALAVAEHEAGSLPLTNEGLRATHYVPLYEAKFIWHFDHRASSYHSRGGERGNRVLPPTSETEHQDANFEAEPFYWVPADEVDSRLADRTHGNGFLFGWRDVTTAIAERTMVPCVIPICGTGDTFLLAFSEHPPQLLACMYANWASLVFDYVTRQKIAYVHLKFNIVKQLPTIVPTFYTDRHLAFIVPKVLELTYTSHSLAPFARDLGHDGPPFAWDEDHRAHLRADLDAFYSRAYGLTRDDLRYILDPSDVKGPDYPSETFRVLKEKEIRQHGFYRTQRLVLAAWDRMEADGTFRELGLADVRMADDVPILIQLPPLDSLRNAAWSWPPSVQPRDRLRYAAQYALWLMNDADDGGRARFLVATLAEPGLLTPLLTGTERTHWIRLVGPEALPAQGVVRLRPAINEAWRSMFEALLTAGQLEERADGAWTRGQHFSLSGLQAQSADAQRAVFAIRAIRGIDIGTLTAAVAQEDNVVWVRFGHAG
ncbi:restriction endonuclease [Mesorhizobium sp. M4A.F.Ca.ET.022.05.2.1]|uniref:Eco57I restriction-modification methylase domain-containing protein n=1 Tax=Mesorhizobium sp. M4A.F.Ca.ET.022.05.2.1 TaxID=2496653 RepID=UPI000FCC36BF|nr:N-6 DNA methylase [Mesorhizobium sp. M4A.F.Ca.ET.022.05.2.1]RVC83050.1 restriction endonuclease [Mesorhizobium sp. M4A.F.Ca.ET.022.05.2.1]